jgi:predicted transcriptional regulator
MADLSFEKQKLDIIKWVTDLKDDTAFERLKMLRENPTKSDWWNEITEEEKAAIDAGLADVKAGRVKSHKEAKKLYEKWL